MNPDERDRQDELDEEATEGRAGDSDEANPMERRDLMGGGDSNAHGARGGASSKAGPHARQPARKRSYAGTDEPPGGERHCEVPGCGRLGAPVGGRGRTTRRRLCFAHFKERNAIRRGAFCLDPNCDGPVWARGYCRRHYEVWLRSDRKSQRGA